MSGLDKLIAIADKQRHGEGVSEYDDLYEIADEIFKESLGCAWRKLAKYMNDTLDGKYKDCNDPGIYRRCDGTEPFQKWLDRWYIPRPLDADGEPIRFGDLFEYRGKGKLEKLPVTGFRFYSDGSIYLYFETSPNCAYTPIAEKARRASTDSIEKLREDMKSKFDGFYTESEYESAVDEWLARAEKLFKEDSE